MWSEHYIRFTSLVNFKYINTINAVVSKSPYDTLVPQKFPSYYLLVLFLLNSKSLFLGIWKLTHFACLSNDLIVITKKFIEDITLAIITGLVVSEIINREAELVFADFIVIRQRTSEGNEGKISLCIMVGDKKGKDMYDITCNIICSYINENGKRCNVIQKTDRSSYIENYHTFTYEYNEFPKIFWNHFLKPYSFYKDYLIVIITGKYSDLGGSFCTRKRYSIKNLIIGENADPNDFVYYDSRDTDKIRINWHKFREVKNYSENDDRYEMILDKIKDFAKEK